MATPAQESRAAWAGERRARVLYAEHHYDLEHCQVFSFFFSFGSSLASVSLEDLSL